jgi:hypothetical protein
LSGQVCTTQTIVLEQLGNYSLLLVPSARHLTGTLPNGPEVWFWEAATAVVTRNSFPEKPRCEVFASSRQAAIGRLPQQIGQRELLVQALS